MIVLNWNRREDTVECVQSLLEMDYSPFRIVVIDNGSTDDSVECLESLFPDVLLIANQLNLGFAAGNNIGIRKALEEGAEYVLLLNNDTVVAPSLLTELIGFGEREQSAGILGPKINYYDRPGVIWFTGGKVHWLTLSAMDKGLDEPDTGQRDIAKRVDFISGCAMFVKRHVLERIGLLDEQFFMYYEDCDFCQRAKNAGFGLAYVPKGMVWHKVSASTRDNIPALRYYRAGSRVRFLRKHRSGLLMLPIFVFLFLSAGLTIARDGIQGKVPASFAYAKGLVEGLLQPSSAIKEETWNNNGRMRTKL